VYTDPSTGSVNVVEQITRMQTAAVETYARLSKWHLFAMSIRDAPVGIVTTSSNTLNPLDDAFRAIIWKDLTLPRNAMVRTVYRFHRVSDYNDRNLYLCRIIPAVRPPSRARQLVSQKDLFLRERKRSWMTCSKVATSISTINLSRSTIYLRPKTERKPR